MSLLSVMMLVLVLQADIINCQKKKQFKDKPANDSEITKVFDYAYQLSSRIKTNSSDIIVATSENAPASVMNMPKITTNISKDKIAVESENATASMIGMPKMAGNNSDEKIITKSDNISTNETEMVNPIKNSNKTAYITKVELENDTSVDFEKSSFIDDSIPVLRSYEEVLQELYNLTEGSGITMEDVVEDVTLSVDENEYIYNSTSKDKLN
ncbi:uncharacterized protein LOC136034559 [Artemia franciscana]|uniref:Uncharacterized protein n=1 Tax=Artemia franciscana TaxID=6661 RepID=A0AA88IKP8_ARTSF|nr:hypothetical protein QYM36_002975 [Artemia franciscana]